MRVAVFVGTRPELIKMAPVLWVLENDREITTLLIHTGQHSDWNMSTVFLEELNLRDPVANLGVSSSKSEGAQMGHIIERAEEALLRYSPDVVLVEGDTNSVAGVAIAAAKLHIQIGHVEAGCRSFDIFMSEEINRKIVADVAIMHFAPTKRCVDNLLVEGVPRDQIHLTGHPLVETVNWMMNFVQRRDTISRLGLKSKRYCLLTLHRQENVNYGNRLASILEGISELGEQVVFPIHPRTKKSLENFGLMYLIRRPEFLTTEPQTYVDILTLIKHAKLVLTDSGGIQQEAAILGVQCITLRDRTEWYETVEAGLNCLAYGGGRSLRSAYEFVTKKRREVKPNLALFGDGTAAERIVRITKDTLRGQRRKS